MALRRVDESKYVVFLYEIKYTYTHSNLEINITCGKYIEILRFIIQTLNDIILP